MIRQFITVTGYEGIFLVIDKIKSSFALTGTISGYSPAMDFYVLMDQDGKISSINPILVATILSRKEAKSECKRYTKFANYLEAYQ